MSTPDSAGSEWEVFPRAPIVEALVDLRAVLPGDVSVETLATIHERVRQSFPHKEQQVELTAEFAFSSGATTTTGRQRTRGVRLQSEDRRWAVQARLDGFTVHHLAPYSNWPTLRAKARELWDHYLHVARPVSVERIGLRYINRMFVPIGVNLDQYFQLEPHLGPALPQKFVWFSMQVAVEDAAIPAAAIIQQARDADSPDHPAHAAVLFDIDVFREARFDPASEEIWGMLDKFRGLKNRIFFDGTTDKAKESFR